jgi:hypothetical protein
MLALPFFRVTVSFTPHHLPFNRDYDASRFVEVNVVEVWKVWTLWKHKTWKM